MNGSRLPDALLRAASRFAPAGQRAEWLADWRAELWYIPRRSATRFCLGAFRDAMWLRRNDTAPREGAGCRLESPLACIAFLSAIAAVSTLAGLLVCGARRAAPGMALFGWLAPIELGSLLVWTAASAIPVNRPPRLMSALRRWLFFAAKLALVLPLVACGLLAVAALAAPQVAVQAFLPTCVLAFRWVYLDQRQRCPMCLRRLSGPVRIGCASQTFLEWYGAESMCTHGHGLLHAPETPLSYQGKRRWLRLDRSWRGLFPGAAGAWK